MQLEAIQAVERYRTLGLAIEAAVVLDHWNEVETLIDERDQLLDRLSAQAPSITTHAKQQLKACDHRLLQFLMNTKSQAATELRQIRERSHARKAYHNAPAVPPALDRAG